MAKGFREEFLLLLRYQDELYTNLLDKVVMKADRLITIRDHIELCDNITDTQIETYNLWVTFEYWEKCRKFWLEYRPYTEDTEIPEITLKTKKFPGQKTPRSQEISNQKTTANSKALAKIDRPPQYPKKAWKINSNDRRFLKSLRIAVDEDGEDDGV